MGMQMKVTEIGRKHEVLVTGDHYVKLCKAADQASTAEPGLTVLENNRRILKSGTIWLEDGIAVGIVDGDYDLTDGDAQIAVIVHGVVSRVKLPVAPSYEQEQAMRLILFVDGEAPEPPVIEIEEEL